MTWSYRPPGFRMGFALSLGAAALILLALGSALFVSGSRRRREPAAAARNPRPGETAVSQARALPAAAHDRGVPPRGVPDRRAGRE